MYMLGHGTALWEPIGDIFLGNRPSKPGLDIGDVGFLDEAGAFEYCFNIFHPSTGAIQKLCPPDMEPLLSLPQPADIRTHAHHFTPGTILTTTGVEVSQLTSSPL